MASDIPKSNNNADINIRLEAESKFQYTIENIMQKVLVTLVFILLCFCIVLPTGSIYGVNVKIILSLLTGSVFLIDLLFNKPFSKHLFVLVCSFLLFLYFNYIKALINTIDITSAISQLIAFMSTLFIIVVPLHVIKMKYATTRDLFLFVMNGIFIFCLIKVCLELLFLCGFMSISDLIGGVKSIFNFEIITLNVGVFARLNLPNDFLIPGLIYSILCRDILKINSSLSKIKSRIYLITAAIALLISYSRYLWLFGGAAFLLGYYCNVRYRIQRAKSIAEINKIKISLVLHILMIFCTLAVLLILSPAVLDFVLDRYFGEFAKDSDSYRVVMKPLLYSMFLDKPFLGHGIGAYVSNYVRFVEAPWNYELQWLAFLMQFGISGVLYLIVLAVAAVKFMFSPTIPASHGLVILFIILLLVGFFNCFLITSATGVAYAYLIIMGIMLKKHNSTICKTKIKEIVNV